MPLSVIHKGPNLDALPEAVRALYKPSGTPNVFILDVEGVRDHPEVQGLKSNSDALLEEKRALAERYKDIDPEKARAALKQVAELEEAKKRAEGDWDSLKGQMITKHTESEAAWKAREEKLVKELERVMIDNEVLQTLADPEMAGNSTLLLPHFQRQVKLVEKDGKFTAQVVGDDEKPRARDASGVPMTIKDLAAELRGKKEFADAFTGTDSSGAGTMPSPSSGRARGDRSDDAKTTGVSGQQRLIAARNAETAAAAAKSGKK